jgi:3-methylcrotonyl-CoA carboxylase alpha subunit
MFKKILIANRGEIACRIQRTARRLGVASVAVYSDADAGALHVRQADEALRIGPAPAKESYLRGAAIIAAARQLGAEAIHPGYGFLSENAAFAADCAAAGLVFIGPPPAAISAMGSKSAAKALMEQAGVPLVPGYHGDDQSAAALQREADRIGYPVLIKASAGGGGKGMRRIERAADFAAALASCQREAAASFGDERVLVEKYLLRPRHIEMQIFADSHGNAVHLFERDCSVQRRHQKVLEEAPAPNMDSARRAQMGAAALAAARAVGYVGAGTVEFIAAPDGTFYFMEMNTRLQVEHPVTEMITGLDLVEWQLRVAAGEPLPLRQEQVALHGHAIEARIYAEDPGRDFMPCVGKLEYLAMPATNAAVRIDSGVVQGDVISPYYDPMIAKLIAWGETRAQACTRLGQALSGFRIAGLGNNVQFLSRLVQSHAFASADLDTALIEREHTALFPPEAPVPDDLFAIAAMYVVARERQAAGPAAAAAVWDGVEGWRLNAPAERRLQFQHLGVQRTVRLQAAASGWQLAIDTASEGAGAGPAASTGVVTTRRASLTLIDDHEARATVGDHDYHLSVVIRDLQCEVFALGTHYSFERLDPLAHVGEVMSVAGGVRALMPGRVVALLVQPGAKVSKGEPLLVLEAMKMEQTFSAPADGVCVAFNVAVGEQVVEGSELVEFRAAGAGEGG